MNSSILSESNGKLFNISVRTTHESPLLPHRCGAGFSGSTVGVLLLMLCTIYGQASSLNDGIPDAWRLRYFGPEFATDSRALATADPDGDGANNYLEYITGTDPLDGASVERAPARVSTYAGSAQGWADGPRSEALLNSPRDLVFDAQGRLWF